MVLVTTSTVVAVELLFLVVFVGESRFVSINKPSVIFAIISLEGGVSGTSSSGNLFALNIWLITFSYDPGWAAFWKCA